jgi:hypothetical protein
MKANPRLPEGYIPFEELVICSNQFINGRVPFQLEGEIPFLVGKGPVPLVWLSVPVTTVTKDGKIWKEVVAANKSASQKIAIISSEEDVSVTVKLDAQILMHVKKLSDQKAEITSLDLRPLGLNVYGDTNGLYIASSLLSHNVFRNVHTMVSMAPRPEKSQE